MRGASVCAECDLLPTVTSASRPERKVGEIVEVLLASNGAKCDVKVVWMLRCVINVMASVCLTAYTTVT